jgi:hypothetical protein
MCVCEFVRLAVVFRMGWVFSVLRSLDSCGKDRGRHNSIDAIGIRNLALSSTELQMDKPVNPDE